MFQTVLEGRGTCPLQSVDLLALTAPVWDKVILPTCWPINLVRIKGLPRNLGELLSESALLCPALCFLF